MKIKGIKVLTASDDVNSLLDHKNSCFSLSWAIKLGLSLRTLQLEQTTTVAVLRDLFPCSVVPHPHISFPFSVQTSDKTILYSVASVLVNCTNSYDTKELVQLAKFSKQHVPEEHPKVLQGAGRRCSDLNTFPGVSIFTDLRSPVSKAEIALLSNQAWL